MLSSSVYVGLLLTPSSCLLQSAQVEFNMQTELRESFECSDASRSSQGGFHFGARRWWIFLGTFHIWGWEYYLPHISESESSMLMVEILKCLIYPSVSMVKFSASVKFPKKPRMTTTTRPFGQRLQPPHHRGLGVLQLQHHWLGQVV